MTEKKTGIPPWVKLFCLDYMCAKRYGANTAIVKDDHTTYSSRRNHVLSFWR